MKQRVGSLKNIIRIGKSLSRVTKRQRDSIQISKIRKKRGGHINRHGGNVENHKDVFKNRLEKST